MSLENCQGFIIPDGGGGGEDIHYSDWGGGGIHIPDGGGGGGGSFHQLGTVNENVLESDFVPLSN